MSFRASPYIDRLSTPKPNAPRLWSCGHCNADLDLSPEDYAAHVKRCLVLATLLQEGRSPYAPSQARLEVMEAMRKLRGLSKRNEIRLRRNLKRGLKRD